MKKKKVILETKFTDAVRDLIDGQPQNGWVSWLFDIQNTLIQYNHLSAFTLKGSSEFANNFYQLKNFFDEVSKLDQSK